MLRSFSNFHNRGFPLFKLSLDKGVSVIKMAASSCSNININVPTPWGHLSTKCWNMPQEQKDLASKHPVVCLHGWQDNANTWDHLIPLLDKKRPFICIDFAGHGLSSNRPLGASYDGVMYMADLKRVLDYFSLESRITIMGHSLGGNISLLFSATFPESVDKCITLDAPAPFPRDAAKAPKQLASAILKNLEFEKKVQMPPAYTYDEALQRFMTGRQEMLNVDSAKTLLERGLLKIEGNKDGQPLYTFARDFRVTLPSFLSLTTEQCSAFVERVACDVLLIQFKDNYYTSLEAANGNEEWFKKMERLKEMVYAVYKANCKSFDRFDVAGQHHTHMDHPERISEFLNQYLLNNESKL